jgi:hypothetical protein
MTQVTGIVHFFLRLEGASEYGVFLMRMVKLCVLKVRHLSRVICQFLSRFVDKTYFNFEWKLL